jgi:hypothetical protein
VWEDPLFSPDLANFDFLAYHLHFMRYLHEMGSRFFNRANILQNYFRKYVDHIGRAV